MACGACFSQIDIGHQIHQPDVKRLPGKQRLQRALGGVVFFRLIKQMRQAVFRGQLSASVVFSPSLEHIVAQQIVAGAEYSQDTRLRQIKVLG